MSAAAPIRVVASDHQSDLLQGVVRVLTDLLDGIRQAPTLADVNIAAGIAHESLEMLSSAVVVALKGL